MVYGDPLIGFLKAATTNVAFSLTFAKFLYLCGKTLLSGQLFIKKKGPKGSTPMSFKPVATYTAPAV
jgi:hypothetical protein